MTLLMVTACAASCAAFVFAYSCAAFAMTIPLELAAATGGEKSEFPRGLLSDAHTTGVEIVGAEKIGS